MAFKKTEEGTSSIQKSLAVLSCFDEEILALSLTDISRKLEIPLATASRIVGTLLKEGFLDKGINDKFYRLGLKCYRLGQLAQKSGVIRNLAYAYMSVLRDRFNETVNLYVRNGKYRVVYEQIESAHYLKRSARIGEKFPLFAGAAGRCFMAYMVQKDIEWILSDLERITENTIVDPNVIYSRIEAIRQNGYEVSAEEREEGISCVAAPIFSSPGQVAVVLVLTGPSFRFTSDVVDSMIPAIIETAKNISTKLNAVNSTLIP